MDEHLSKKNAQQTAEEIDAMGQESEEKAVKWVQEVEQREETKRQEQEDRQEELLQKKRKYKKNVYYDALLAFAKNQLKEYDIAPGYHVDIVLKDDGRLIFGLQKVGFRWYAKGMKICGEPKYDKNCVIRLVVQTMLSLDELQKYHEAHTTNSGIVLPSKML